MDMITFDELAAQHRKSLEGRMRKAKIIRNNLTRMVEEAITDINKRAEEDRANISELFTKLIANQEEEISILRKELGLDKSKNEGVLAGQVPASNIPHSETELFSQKSMRLTPGIKRRT